MMTLKVSIINDICGVQRGTKLVRNSDVFPPLLSISAILMHSANDKGRDDCIHTYIHTHAYIGLHTLKIC